MTVPIYSKPPVENAWADSAVPTTDIVQPPNSFVSAGWLQSSTPPPRQYFNWALNFPSAGIRYYCQNGIPDWDAAEQYEPGSIVFSSGLIWQCLVANIGQAPTAFYPAGTYWGYMLGYAPLSYVNTTFAPLVSPVLSGVPTTTLASGSNGNQIANVNYVAEQIAPLATTASVNAGLALKANLTSPTFTGVPAAPTAAAGTNTTQLATTAFLQAALAASPTLGGVPKAPTAVAGTNTTQIASTAFVEAAVAAAIDTGALTSPGNITFGNGLVMSWGVANGIPNSPGTTVNFPAGTFTTTCFIVLACAYGQNATVTVLSFNKNSFQLINGVSGACTWIAVGY